MIAKTRTILYLRETTEARTFKFSKSGRQRGKGDNEARMRQWWAISLPLRLPFVPKTEKRYDDKRTTKIPMHDKSTNALAKQKTTKKRLTFGVIRRPQRSFPRK